MATSRKGVSYVKGNIPLGYDQATIARELQNVQRAVPSVVLRKESTSISQEVTDRVILMQATSSALTLTLLSPTSAPLFPVVVKLTTDSTFSLSLVGVVDGITNPTIDLAGTTITIAPDPAGTQWVVLASSVAGLWNSPDYVGDFLLMGG